MLVLVAEDDPIENRALCERVVSAIDGCESVQAFTVAQTTSLLVERKPAALLLDLTLSDSRDPIDTARAVMSVARPLNVPVIAISGHVDSRPESLDGFGFAESFGKAIGNYGRIETVLRGVLHRKSTSAPFAPISDGEIVLASIEDLSKDVRALSDRVDSMAGSVGGLLDWQSETQRAAEFQDAVNAAVAAQISALPAVEKSQIAELPTADGGGLLDVLRDRKGASAGLGVTIVAGVVMALLQILGGDNGKTSGAAKPAAESGANGASKGDH